MLTPGQLLDARYRIERHLAEGGMAHVYVAVDAKTNARVAVKVMKKHLFARPDMRARFIAEAQTAAKVQSRNVVRVLDVDEDEAAGVAYLVMELLEGETLQARLERGPLAQAEALAVLGQVAKALDAAHKAGLVHRDLKPGNVFLEDDDGRVVAKILDFGIARSLDSGHVTATEIGTPAYAAPEQLAKSFRARARAQGIAVADDVSPATDVWALGLLAYECLTGAPPLQVWGVESSTELPLRILEVAPVPSAVAGAAARRLPHGFDGWFARCVDRDASARHQRAGDALGELATLALGGGAPAYASASAQGPAVTTAVEAATFVPDRAQRAPASTTTARGAGALETSLGVGTYVPAAATGGRAASTAPGVANAEPGPHRAPPRPKARLVVSLAVVGVVAIGALTIGRFVVSAPEPRAPGSSAAKPVGALVEQGDRRLMDGDLDGAQQSLDEAGAVDGAVDARVMLGLAQVAVARADARWLAPRLLTSDDVAQPAAKRELELAAERAKKAADRAFELASKEPAALRAKIDALRIGGDLQGARKLVPSLGAASAHPDSALTLAALDLAEESPSLPTVIERLRGAAAAEQGLGRARALLAYALARSGDVAGARAELDRLAALARPYPLMQPLRAFVARAAARPASSASEATRAAGSSESDGAGSETLNAAGHDWQKRAAEKMMRWQVAADFCARSTLAGGGWRLPTPKELKALWDSKAVEHDPHYYWSSSEVVPRFSCGMGNDDPYKLYVNFDTGLTGSYCSSVPLMVRCVR